MHEIEQDQSLSVFELCRKYHSLTPVIEPGLVNEKDMTRLIWATPLRKKYSLFTNLLKVIIEIN